MKPLSTEERPPAAPVQEPATSPGYGPADPTRRKRHDRFVIGIALAILILVAFRGVAGNDFVNYDDPAYVTENRHVQNGLNPAEIGWAFTASFISNWHPLTWMSLMLDHDLYGNHAAGYLGTNVILHLLGTILLFLVLVRMTGRPWRSGLAAALFAVHPLHVESVAWISERKDVLSGLFWMLGLWAYVRYAERPGGVRYGWVVLFFVAGLLSKPMVVTFPFVLLLLDYWPLGRVDPGRGRPADPAGAQAAAGSDAGAAGRRFAAAAPSALLREKIPLLLLAAAGSAITFWVQREGAAMATLENLPFGGRLGNAAVSYAQYLVKTVLPVDLAVFYPYPGGWPWWKILLSLGLLLSISALAFGQARLRPYLAVGWLWYLGMLVPVIGLVQVGAQAMADRYSYLPLIGVFVMVVWGAGDLVAGNARRRVAAGVVAGVVLAILTWAAHLQVGVWKDSRTLFTHALAVTDGNYQAHKSLGDALRAEGRYGEAVGHYREAVRIAPGYAAAYNNMGVALMSEGRFAEAMNANAAALKIEPENGNMHFSRADLLARQGLWTGAVAEYRFALAKKPYDAALHNNFGVALTRLGRLDEAAAAFRSAIRIDAAHAGAHCNLGMLLLGRGDVDGAIGHFRAAIGALPDYANAHYRLSLALRGKGLGAEAAFHLREACRLNPDVAAQEAVALPASARAPDRRSAP